MQIFSHQENSEEQELVEVMKFLSTTQLDLGTN